MRVSKLLGGAVIAILSWLPQYGAAQSVQSCLRSSECSNGLYCDGAEVCVGAVPLFGIRGVCVRGPAPCTTPGAVCNEALDRCEARPQCPDRDGDGYADVACGGNDCDDSDARRYPGATEVCDPAGVDEDCDDTTFGNVDQDGDGFVSAACCNGANCGTDCDDTAFTINPRAIEICNRLDDNCDGRVDDGAGDQLRLYADCDLDGFGTADRMVLTCGYNLGANGQAVSVPFPNGQGSQAGCYLSPYDSDPDDSNPNVWKPSLLSPQEPFQRP